MIRFTGIILLFSIGVMACNSTSQKQQKTIDSDFKDSVICAIHLFKDHRELAPILPHLQSRSELRRWHAALALCSFSDSASVPYLELALKDRSTDVRKMAAFALAQTKSQEASEVLLRAIKAARPEKERPFLLEMLGLCGRQNGEYFLLQLRTNDPLDESGRIKGLYRLSLSRKDPQLEKALKSSALNATDSLQLYYAISGLLRLRAPLDSEFSDRLIDIYNSHSFHDLKLKCVQALTLIESHEDSLFIRRTLHSLETNSHIKQALYQSLSNKRAIKAKWLPTLFTKDAPFNEKWAWANAMAVRNELPIPEECDSSIYLYIKLARGSEDAAYLLSEKWKQFSKNPAWMSLCIDQIDPGQELFMDSLYSYFKANKMAPILRNRIYAKLLQSPFHNQDSLLAQGLRSGDMALVSLAIYVLRDNEWSEKTRLHYGEILKSIWPSYRHAEAWETHLDIQRLLQKWHLTEDKDEYEPQRASFGMRHLKQLANEFTVEMYVHNDTLSFTIDQRYAPFTAMTIANAVKSAYYNSKSFHRIVPLFVAQTGCQRGDGWGSPEALLRSELSPMSFERGAIGIASAGKDTEGWQLFFMLEHAPHLDGRYSYVGKLKQGVEVLDRLMPGDEIRGMKIVN